MITASEFQLTNVQAALFTPPAASNFTSTSALGSILGRFSEYYNGPAQALPLGDEVPPEFPRIILHSVDNQWGVQAGPARIDAVWNATSEGGEMSQVVGQCAAVLKHYVTTVNPQVWRVALVSTWAHFTEQGAAKLIDFFCGEQVKERVFTSPASFAVHYEERSRLQGTQREINKLIRCGTAQFAGGGQPVTGRPAIFFQEDFNTPQENTRPMNLEEVDEFFQHVQEEACEKLRVYFPDRSE